ncbi:TPA: hypothetical protein U9M35_002869 [Acinetobacter baumannii]|nr:hypothetical protein [Acinetobacter baumannii]
MKLRLIKNGQVLITARLGQHSIKFVVLDLGACREIGHSMPVLDVCEHREKIILIESGAPSPYEVFGKDRAKYLQFTRKLMDFADRKLRKAA